ncbi:hypothetical protein, partial [Pseudobutyrivibrio sp.]
KELLSGLVFLRPLGLRLDFVNKYFRKILYKKDTPSKQCVLRNISGFYHSKDIFGDALFL